jgi:acetylornithine/succinyldiaminopimelate/putrescine aminotransferase
MAVAQATLGRLRSIDAPGIAARLGPRLARSFAGIDGVASVRGAGFLLGAVLEDGIDSRAVFGEALAAGLVVNAPVPGVVRLMPPFVVTEADCDEAVALLGVAIGRAGASARKSTGERG